MDGLTLVNNAEKMGKELADNRISVSQLRKFLSAVNGISNKLDAADEMKEEIFNEIQLLRVKLAYQTGRNRTLKLLFNELEPMIKGIKTKEDYVNFAGYMEAIIAYHKYNGGN